MKRVSMESACTIPEDDVHLTIAFGDAQIGSSIVRLDGNHIESGQITNLLLPIPSPRNHKSSLAIKSVVTDVNDQTNHTSITYTLTTGQTSQRYRQDATVDQEGDSIIYRAYIEMIPG